MTTRRMNKQDHPAGTRLLIRDRNILVEVRVLEWSNNGLAARILVGSKNTSITSGWTHELREVFDTLPPLADDSSGDDADEEDYD